LRRGYFVEGLSGVQYADESAAAELARLAAAPQGGTTFSAERSLPEGGRDQNAVSGTSEAPVVLVCSSDPANIYGAGAPLDIELLGGGVARLPRVAGNFLVLRDGRPILIIEAHGKRLTGVPWASQADLERALILLPKLTGPKRRILKVETYNGEPAAASPVATALLGLGFVGDYPGMAYYAGWPRGSAQT
jgi:ATP-dependent Lhr-like helicase